jgi:hypothetical protein
MSSANYYTRFEDLKFEMEVSLIVIIECLALAESELLV